MSDDEAVGELSDGDPWLWAMSEEFDGFQRLVARGRMKGRGQPQVAVPFETEF